MNIYDSGRLPKVPKGHGYRGGTGKHYVFRIRGMHVPGPHAYPVRLELHSSQSQYNVAANPSDPAGAATVINLRRNEAEHLLAALLTAMNE